ncbi:MAG TPA: hypothetical protein DCE18_04855 [Syntrophobacteraceae bacterium]|jgi:hypothetical protein|nr:hypothetical protein [Syntrophobacteraceae bacterium]
MAKISLFQWGLFQKAPCFQTYPPEEEAVTFDGDAPGVQTEGRYHEDDELILLVATIMQSGVLC